jgi:hypothetical protein
MRFAANSAGLLALVKDEPWLGDGQRVKRTLTQIHGAFFAALFALTLSWYTLLGSYYFLVKGGTKLRSPDWEFMNQWQTCILCSTAFLCLGWWQARAIA